MKVFRIWLLVLLAALLPVRGAIAAAMLCPPSAVGMHSQMLPMDHGAAGTHDHGHQDHAQHDHAAGGHHDGHDGAHGGKGPMGHDKCNLCSACCSATPLLSTMPSVPPPHDEATVAFPDVAAPAPSFLSDGQERPPRSI